MYVNSLSHALNADARKAEISGPPQSLLYCIAKNSVLENEMTKNALVFCLCFLLQGAAQSEELSKELKQFEWMLGTWELEKASFSDTDYYVIDCGALVVEAEEDGTALSVELWFSLSPDELAGHIQWEIDSRIVWDKGKDEAVVAGTMKLKKHFAMKLSKDGAKVHVLSTNSLSMTRGENSELIAKITCQAYSNAVFEFVGKKRAKVEKPTAVFSVLDGGLGELEWLIGSWSATEMHRNDARVPLSQKPTGRLNATVIDAGNAIQLEFLELRPDSPGQKRMTEILRQTKGGEFRVDFEFRNSEKARKLGWNTHWDLNDELKGWYVLGKRGEAWEGNGKEFAATEKDGKQIDIAMKLKRLDGEELLMSGKRSMLNGSSRRFNYVLTKDKNVSSGEN